MRRITPRIFNLEQIRKELDSQDWEEEPYGFAYRRVYLGSVLALRPSGKFYPPWACANVSLCPKCAGKDSENCSVCEGHGSEDLLADANWQIRAEAELESIGCSLEIGDDPCDLFAEECSDGT